MRILFTHREMDLIVYELAEELARMPSIEVYITCSDQEPVPSSEGITYLPVPALRHKLSLSAIRVIRHYNQRYRFDLIYSVSSTGLSNALWATLGSRTINVGYRGTGAKVRRYDPSYYLAILNPRLRHIVCENIYIRDYLRSFVNERKLSVAVKPFKLEWVAKAQAEPIHLPTIDPSAETLKLIFVGNTKGRPHKGLRTLIEAINILQDEAVQTIVIGDYETSDYELAMGGAVASSFHFLGSSHQAMEYMAGADVFVLSSLRDASPRVVREAMALGLPTIVSDIEGSRDLIQDGCTGLLFDPLSAEDLADKIRWMQAHPERRRAMGRAGLQRIGEVFGFDAYLRHFVQLFSSLLSGRG